MTIGVGVGLSCVLGASVGACLVLWWFRYKHQAEQSKSKEFDREWNEMQADSQKRMLKLWEERQRNPKRCDVCSEKGGNDVFFEGFSWYHCPKCGQHGFASMYGGCTGCANTRRFGNPP